MIILSLNKINETTPYRVYMSQRGDYIFQNCYGTLYGIGFIDDEPIGGCKSYQFSIENLTHSHTPYDPGVKDTIMSIILEFFRENEYVLLYICDTADGREGSRNRLFLKWFEQSETTNKFTICTANAHVEDEIIYAAIIVSNSNPNLKAVIDDFNETASTLSK